MSHVCIGAFSTVESCDRESLLTPFKEITDLLCVVTSSLPCHELINICIVKGGDLIRERIRDGPLLIDEFNHNGFVLLLDLDREPIPSHSVIEAIKTCTFDKDVYLVKEICGSTTSYIPLLVRCNGKCVTWSGSTKPTYDLLCEYGVLPGSITTTDGYVRERAHKFNDDNARYYRALSTPDVTEATNLLNLNKEDPTITYLSLVALAKITVEVKDRLPLLLQALNINDKRIEAYAAIAMCCYQLQLYNIGWKMAKEKATEENILTTETEEYWKLLDGASLCAYYSNNKEMAGILMRRILQCPNVPEDTLQRVRSNLTFIS